MSTDLENSTPPNLPQQLQPIYQELPPNLESHQAVQPVFVPVYFVPVPAQMFYYPHSDYPSQSHEISPPAITISTATVSSADSPSESRPSTSETTVSPDLVDVKCSVCMEKCRTRCFGKPLCCPCRGYFHYAFAHRLELRCQKRNRCVKKYQPGRRLPHCKACGLVIFARAEIFHGKVRHFVRQAYIASNPQPKAIWLCFPTDIPKENDEIAKFARFRRAVYFSRYYIYRDSMESEMNADANRDITLGSVEVATMKRLLLIEDCVFSGIDRKDLVFNDTLMLLWATMEQTLLTFRHFGHETRTVYSFDGSFTRADLEDTKTFLRKMMTSNAKPTADVAVLAEKLHQAHLYLLDIVCPQLRDLHLDEMGEAALYLFLLCETVGTVPIKEETRSYFRKLASEAMDYLKAEGKGHEQEEKRKAVKDVTDSIENLAQQAADALESVLKAIES